MGSAYAVEYILSSLVLTFGKKDLELDEIEIQKGILQVVRGLQFLHSNRVVHGNISPEAIYVNSKVVLDPFLAAQQLIPHVGRLEDRWIQL
jgi:serine/threonine protein kinase